MTLCSVMLIVLGTDLDPDAVTEALNLVPNQAWRKGERKRVTREDGETHFFDSIYEWGGWKSWLPKEMSRAMSLADQLKHWLEVLQGHPAEVKALKAQGYTVLLDCFFISKTYWLLVPSELQFQLGELGVDLEMAFQYAKLKPQAKRRRPVVLASALKISPVPLAFSPAGTLMQ